MLGPVAGIRSHEEHQELPSCTTKVFYAFVHVVKVGNVRFQALTRSPGFDKIAAARAADRELYIYIYI